MIFLAIGFETTACTLAATLDEAVRGNVRNFKMLSALKTMPEALRALFSAPGVAVDGLILPGHVTAVTGTGILSSSRASFTFPAWYRASSPPI